MSSQNLFAVGICLLAALMTLAGFLWLLNAVIDFLTPQSLFGGAVVGLVIFAWINLSQSRR